MCRGSGYIAASPELLCAVLAMFALGTFAMNMNVIAPVYADRVLQKGVHGFGLLLSSMGAGSLVGALLVTGRSRKSPSRRILFASAYMTAIVLMALGFTRIFPLALLAVALLGFFNILFMTTANSTIQLNSADQYRGRAMSVYTLAFAGTTPLGNLFAGGITEKLGPGMGFVLCGAATGLLVLAVMMSTIFKKQAAAGNLN